MTALERETRRAPGGDEVIVTAVSDGGKVIPEDGQVGPAGEEIVDRE